MRHVIEHELARRPDDSDRAIARRVGCSPSTVGAVRNPKVSNLDTCSVEEAEESTKQLREAFLQLADGFYGAAQLLLSNNVAPAEIARALLDGKRAFEARGGIEMMAPFARLLFDPILDYVLDPKAVEFWRPDWDHPTFVPFTEAEKLALLGELAGSDA